jgi:hypothetical protein
LIDILFSDQDIRLYVKGKGEVHVSGTFQLDETMFGDSDDELDDEDLMAEYPSSSDDEEGAEHPAYLGDRVMEMEDSSSSSSSEEPPQKKHQPHKPQHQPQHQQKGGSQKKKNNNNNNQQHQGGSGKKKNNKGSRK